MSSRETEIAELLAWGAAKKEVADMLTISTRTVENTARNIYAKIGIQKATELCVWWFTTKCGVSIDLSPLKRRLGALALLVLMMPTVFGQNTPDMARTSRTATRPARSIRTARRGEQDTNFDYLLTL